MRRSIVFLGASARCDQGAEKIRMANDSRRMGGPRDSDRRSDPAASGIAARSRSSRCVLIIALPAGFIFIAMAHYAFLKGVGKQHNIDRALARATLESISQIEALRFP